MPDSTKQHKGIMVAFFLSGEDARSLALDDDNALPAKELHVTLAYIGKTDETDVDRDELTRFAGRFAEGYQPIEAALNGTAKFLDIDSEGRSAGVILVDSQEIHDMQADLVRGLTRNSIPFATDHSFTPHITLTRLADGEHLPDIQPRTIRFDTLTVSWGGERFDYPLVKRSAEVQVMPDEEIQVRFLPAMFERGANGPTVEDLMRNTSMPVPFVASTEGRKADGFDLRMDEWDISEYRTYGPVLFGHDHWSPPIGRGEARIADKLYIDVTFDEDDERAMLIRGKALKKMMAGSVGWHSERRGGGKNRNILREFSMVPVGMDPAALPMLPRGGESLHVATLVQEILGAVKLGDAERSAFEEEIAHYRATIEQLLSFLRAERDSLLELPELTAFINGSREPVQSGLSTDSLQKFLAELQGVTHE